MKPTVKIKAGETVHFLENRTPDTIPGMRTLGRQFVRIAYAQRKYDETMTSPVPPIVPPTGNAPIKFEQDGVLMTNFGYLEFVNVEHDIEFTLVTEHPAEVWDNEGNMYVEVEA